MKNNPNAFEPQSNIEPTDAEHQNVQYEYPKKNVKKKSSSLYDIFFNIFEWFPNKLSASYNGIAAFSGAAIGAIANFISGIFGDDTVSSEIYEVHQNQVKQQEQIKQILRKQQDSEIETKELKEQSTHLINLLERIEVLSNIEFYSTTNEALRMSVDTPEMSMTDIPESLVCPITQLIFKDPVTLKCMKSDGTFFHQTYEREAIVKWKNINQRRGQDFIDPLTRLSIVSNPQTASTDEIKEEMVRQFWKRSSTKAVTTVPQWRAQIDGTLPKELSDAHRETCTITRVCLM